MSVREYYLKFTQLFKYAPAMVADSKARMSKFLTGVSKDMDKQFRTTILVKKLDISGLIVHAQQIEEEKIKKMKEKI